MLYASIQRTNVRCVGNEHDEVNHVDDQRSRSTANMRWGRNPANWTTKRGAGGALAVHPQLLNYSEHNFALVEN